MYNRLFLSAPLIILFLLLFSLSSNLMERVNGFQKTEKPNHPKKVSWAKRAGNWEFAMCVCI